MSTASSDPALGAALPYRLGRLLGRGRTGSVHVAEPVGGGGDVALRIISAELVASPDARKRLLAECAAAAELEHPNVLPIHEAGDVGGVVYVAMELVDGTDLATALENGPLSPEQTLAVVEQTAAALHAAHCEGLVHRDLRPAGIFLEAGSQRIYVSDFGVGRLSAAAPYAAPEVVEGRRVDGRADVYSLGRVLADCLGKAPGEELDEVVATALAHDPWDRYTTAPELADAVRRAIATLPASAPPAPTPPPAAEKALEPEPAPELEPEPPLKSASSRRRALTVAGAIVLALGLVAVIAAVLSGGHKAAPGHPTSAVAPKIATSLEDVLTPVSSTVSSFASLPFGAPNFSPLYDRVANSTVGVRYRLSPDRWCGRPAAATDPCMQGVVPGVGAAEGEQLRIYCYTQGTPVLGNSWWARVQVNPDEYVPVAYLQSGLTNLAPTCQ